tara:strand:+ start:1359 stop:2255 length:897 start_codon:yes stop_codon:yes gene_type:complete
VAIDIVQNTAGSLIFIPEDLASRPSSCTASFRKPSGDELEAPSVAVASIGSGGVSSVSAVTNQTQITVDDATGITSGAFLWMETGDGWAGAIRISEITGTSLTLESRPPGTVDVTAKIYGLALTSTVSASKTDTRDQNYRIDYTITSVDASVAHRRQMVNVVAMSFADPVTSAEVSRYAAANFPGVSTQKDAGWYRGIAERASDRIRQKLVAAGNYPHRVGDQSVFKSSGMVAMRIELAHEGLIVAGFDPESYINAQESRLGTQIRESIANTWIDRNDDDAVGVDEVRGFYSFRAKRA